MKEFLSCEAIATLITTTQSASYSDVVELGEDGGERLKQDIDPFVARAIEEVEFMNGRVISVKLAGKRSHRLATASSGKK